MSAEVVTVFTVSLSLLLLLLLFLFLLLFFVSDDRGSMLLVKFPLSLTVIFEVVLPAAAAANVLATPPSVVMVVI